MPVAHRTIVNTASFRKTESRHSARTGRPISMPISLRRFLPVTFACVILFGGAALLWHSHPSEAATKRLNERDSKEPAAQSDTNQALRFNTLGVAYMNQQRPADAQ